MVSAYEILRQQIGSVYILCNLKFRIRSQAFVKSVRGGGGVRQIIAVSCKPMQDLVASVFPFTGIPLSTGESVLWPFSKRDHKILVRLGMSALDEIFHDLNAHMSCGFASRNVPASTRELVLRCYV